MNSDGSVEFRSQETSQFSSHHCDDNGISYDENLAVSAGDGKRGNRYIGNNHYSSCDRGFCHSDDGGIGGYRPEETSHYSSSQLWSLL